MKKIFLKVLMLSVVIFLSVGNFDSFASELPSQEANLIVQPLRELSTLQSITFIERSNSNYSHTYSKDSNQLSTRLNTLTKSSLDFKGVDTEYYDVFYSDANGNFDVNGGYITIEGVYKYSRGFNLTVVKLNFKDSQSVNANTVSSYCCCGKTAVPESIKNAIDNNVNTYTALGNTVGNERMRLTLGFASNVQKPLTKDFQLLKADAGDSKVDLQWSKAENTTSYNVKRATTSGGKYETIATTSDTSYIDKTAVNGTTYYYVVSAVNRGGESENSNELSAKPLSPAVTLEITSVDKAKVSDLITANVIIHNAVNICAEDIKIAFDTNKLKLISAEGADGIKIYKEDAESENLLRYITASLGKTNAANGDKTLLKLTFKTKSAGDAKIDITKGRIADNSTLEEDVEEENCGETIIHIERKKDVNRSGEFTLLDLGIDAWYFGDAAADTDSSKYDTDVIENGYIDDEDLTEIVRQMLNNVDYNK